MSSGGEPGHLHPERTRVHDYEYFFYDKHHGRGGLDVSQWASDVSEAEEFGIFDQADEFDLSDRTGNLYGVLQGIGRKLRSLGTLDQQVAKFPQPHPGHHWHGFPLGPLKKSRQPQPPMRRLPKDALEKMEAHGLLTPVQRVRLAKGKRA